MMIGSIVLVSSFASFAGETTYANLDQIIEMAIENNQSIKDLEANASVLDEVVRQAGTGARISDEMHKKYRIFRFMWNSEDKEFDHLKSKSNTQLTEYLTSLMVKLQSTQNPANAQRYLDEADFIEYAFIFGNEEPDLTDKELYSQFIKNAELLVLQQENMRDKTLVNKQLIEGGLHSGMTALYVNVINIKSGIELQNEMLDLRLAILEDLQALYEQGLISRVDLEINELEVDKLRSEIRTLELNLEKLLATLKVQIGLDVEDDLSLFGTPYSALVLADKSISNYVEETQSSNTTLYGLALDFEYYTKNKELFDQYVSLDFGPEFEQLSDQLYTLEKQVGLKEAEIEVNVKYAYEDMLYLEKNVETKAEAQRNAFSDLTIAQQQLELGLIKTTDLHQLQIAYLASQNSFKQSLRELSNAKIKFGTMTKYGTEY